MGNHPSSEEFVVTRVQVVFAQPKIVGEAVQKIRVFQNNSSVCGRSARKTRDTSIDMRRRGDFDITNGQSERSEHFPNGEFLTARLNTLRRANTANLLIFETSQNIRKQCRRPDRIVVGKDDNVRGGIPNAV